MKIAIMQPYLFPYIGYWQLIGAVDKFVIYDDIQYEKSGWMRRNRILVNGNDKLFSVPVAKGSDYADVCDRKIAEDYIKEVHRILGIIKSNYCKAPFFEIVYPVLEECFTYKSNNLFEYIYYSVMKLCEYMDIKTEIVVSSTLDIDKTLKKEYRVLEICKALAADTYINPIGGKDLYSKEQFRNDGIELQFLKSNLSSYEQGTKEFIPALSIIDLLMRLSRDEIKEQLQDYSIL